MLRAKDLCVLTDFILILNCIALVNANIGIPQCTNNTHLSDRFRNVKQLMPPRVPKCDDHFALVAWYRFLGAAGTRMPSLHVKQGSCSTATPGWVSGSHPAGGGHSNSTRSAQVCFDIYQNESCGASVNILITDCGGYYVYRLPRIENCSKVYCGEDGSSRPTPTMTQTKTTQPRIGKTSSSVDETEVSGKSNCSDSGRKDVDNKDCMSQEINTLYREVGYLRDANMTREAQSKAAEDIINKLINITDLDNVDQYSAPERLNQEQLVYSVKILQDIIKLNISNASSLDVLQPANNILNLRNKKTFDDIKNSSEVIDNLVVSLEDYGFQLGRDLKREKNESTVIKTKPNLELRVKTVKPKSSSRIYYTMFQFTNASFQLSPNAFHPGDNTTAVVVVVRYSTLHLLLAQRKLRRGQTEFDTTISDSQYILNNDIITVSVRPKPPEEFENPVRIMWRKKQLHKDLTECVFWKPEMSESIWSTKGCEKLVKDNNITCECNHLTAFASIHMSDEMLSKQHRHVLEIISTIGCSLSLLGIILTVVSYGLFWRKLHSKAETEVRPRVLMHLCVAVGITDILAIIAGPAQENKIFCTTVSISLYFFVLSVFGWMLCEGILIYFLLVRVFSGLGGRHLKVFYGIGWGIPTVVVAISVGLVDREQFITEHACWFRANGPLLWIFLGLTSITLLVNIIVFTLVLKKMLSSHNLQNAAALHKAKAAMKATAVLLPLLGLTWLFALLSFNGNTIVFKYLFAIFNSLQGFMIFFFHVVINKQIHDAMRKKIAVRNLNKLSNRNHRKCRTLSTSENNFETGSFPRTPKFLQEKRNSAYCGTLFVISNENNNNNNNKDQSNKSKGNMYGLTLQDLDRN